MYLSLANRGLALQNLLDRQFDLLNSYDSKFDVNPDKYQVSSTDESHTIYVSLPGHDKSSVKLSVEDSKLLIRAEAPDGSVLIKNESFKFKLPKGCDAKSIDAQMTNGILTVSISKEIEKPESKRIEIAVN
jgi:HSP20 family molecular chaperone IbpA